MYDYVPHALLIPEEGIRPLEARVRMVVSFRVGAGY